MSFTALATLAAPADATTQLKPFSASISQACTVSGNNSSLNNVIAGRTLATGTFSLKNLHAPSSGSMTLTAAPSPRR